MAEELTILAILCLLTVLACDVARPLPVIKLESSSTDREGKAFREFAAQFPIRPAEAATKVEQFEKLRHPEGPHGFYRFAGIVDDEYLFNYNHKKGFTLWGYRVNVITGSVQEVTRNEARSLHNGLFPRGYIPRSDLHQYLNQVGE